MYRVIAKSAISSRPIHHRTVTKFRTLKMSNNLDLAVELLPNLKDSRILCRITLINRNLLSLLVITYFAYNVLIFRSLKVQDSAIARATDL